MIQEGMRSTSEAIEKPSMTRLFKAHNLSNDMEITDDLGRRQEESPRRPQWVKTQLEPGQDCLWTVLQQGQ